jgi:hypothetical protein
MKAKNPTNTVLTAPSNSSLEPVTFRLPACGGDPHFGLTKSYYYGLEAKGLIELLRLRGKGKKRGVTLVPFNKIKEIVFGGLAK